MTNVGFNWAVTVGDVVRVVLLFYLMPAWTVVLAWPMLGEKPTPLSLLRLALALAGVAIVLKTGMVLAGARGHRGLAGAGGRLQFSLTNILLRKLQSRDAASRMLAMFAGGAVVAMSAAAAGHGVGLVAAPPLPRRPGRG